MDFEDLQKTWQAQAGPGVVTIQSEILLKQVRRNYRQFQGTILWRDIREVSVAFLLALYFSYCGWESAEWPKFLIATACFGIGLFMLVDRFLQKRKMLPLNHSLREYITASLGQVRHQTWLLRNVFWWYLLPLAAAIGVSEIHELWQRGDFSPSAMGSRLFVSLVVTGVFWGVYQLNQFVVRSDFEPRRKELEDLLDGLKGD